MVYRIFNSSKFNKISDGQNFQIYTDPMGLFVDDMDVEDSVI